MIKSSFLDAFMFLSETILFTFVVTFVYINTNRSILAGAFTHMMSNFFTSQTLSPYSAELSNVIRYVSMVFFFAVIVYSLSSSRFKQKFDDEIRKIKSSEPQKTT